MNIKHNWLRSAMFGLCHTWRLLGRNGESAFSLDSPKLSYIRFAAGLLRGILEILDLSHSLWIRIPKTMMEFNGLRRTGSLTDPHVYAVWA